MKLKTYEPNAGMHIADACKEAVALARNNAVNVSFLFNEIEMVAGPDTNADELAEEYAVANEQRNIAYRASPEGKARARARAAEIQAKQASHDALVRGLKTAIASGEDAIMAWLRAFQDASDDIGVSKNLPAVIATFERAGYRANENVGLPLDHYDSRPVLGRYIIGQAISCMKSGMPPHQITHTFVERYFALPAP